MKTIREIFNLPSTKGAWGVEIEAEGENLAMLQGRGWHTEDDPSLRGDYPKGRSEYVFDGPTSLPITKKRLELWKKHHEENGSQFNFSFRTSTHVHMNVQDCTEEGVFNIIYTYYLLEGVLLDYCGEHRKNNRFCLRLADADGCYDNLSYIFSRGIGSLLGVNTDNIRYSALNLAALHKYGSLEFRAMRGTDNIEELMTWIEALNEVKEYALSRKNIQDIMKDVNDNKPEDFAALVLKDIMPAFVTDAVAHNVNEGFSLTIDLPHIHNVYQQHLAKEAERLALKAKVPAKQRLDEVFYEGNVWNPAAPALRNLNAGRPINPEDIDL